MIKKKYVHPGLIIININHLESDLCNGANPSVSAEDFNNYIVQAED